jgi:hypothetical protein
MRRGGQEGGLASSDRTADYFRGLLFGRRAKRIGGGELDAIRLGGPDVSCPGFGWCLQALRLGDSTCSMRQFSTSTYDILPS